MPKQAASAESARTDPAFVRQPLLIYALAGGVFLMGSTELIVAGILPELSADIGVGVADAGLMITVFAIGMIIGSPLMAIATLKLQRRLVLSLSLIVFAIGHVVVAVSSDFPLILGMRFGTALATGALFGAALGARIGTHRPYGVRFTAAAATFLVLVGLALFSHSPAATVVLVFLLGLFRHVDQSDSHRHGSAVRRHGTYSALGASGRVIGGSAIAALYFLPRSVLVTKDSRAARPRAASVSWS